MARRIRSHQHHDVLVELVRRAPTDDALGLALARSYLHRREFGRAREELDRVALRTPSRAKEVAAMIEQVDEEQSRLERDIRLAEEGRRARNAADRPDLVGKKHRFGMRFGIGTDVHETSGAHLGMGFYRTHSLSPGTAFGWRFDWTKYDDDMQTHKAVAVGAFITRRLLDARVFELAAVLGPRVELRYGGTVPSASFDRAAIGGDLTLELLPRAIPAALGLRFNHSLTDGARSSALLVELGFEVR